MNVPVLMLFIGGALLIVGLVLLLLNVVSFWAPPDSDILAKILIVVGFFAILGSLAAGGSSISHRLKTASVCVACNEKHSNIFCADEYCDKCGAETELAYKKCLHCGEKATDSLATCSHCGMSLLAEDNVSHVAAKAHRCTECGVKNKKDASFCKQCGKKLPAEGV